MEPRFDRWSSILERVLGALVAFGVVIPLLRRLTQTYIPNGNFVARVLPNLLPLSVLTLAMMLDYVLMPRQALRRVRTLLRFAAWAGFCALLVLFVGDARWRNMTVALSIALSVSVGFLCLSSSRAWLRGLGVIVFLYSIGFVAFWLIPVYDTPVSMSDFWSDQAAHLRVLESGTDQSRSLRVTTPSEASTYTSGTLPTLSLDLPSLTGVSVSFIGPDTIASRVRAQDAHGHVWMIHIQGTESGRTDTQTFTGDDLIQAHVLRSQYIETYHARIPSHRGWSMSSSDLFETLARQKLRILVLLDPFHYSQDFDRYRLYLYSIGRYADTNRVSKTSPDLLTLPPMTPPVGVYSGPFTIVDTSVRQGVTWLQPVRGFWLWTKALLGL